MHSPQDEIRKYKCGTPRLEMNAQGAGSWTNQPFRLAKRTLKKHY